MRCACARVVRARVCVHVCICMCACVCVCGLCVKSIKSVTEPCTKKCYNKMT